MTTTRAAPRSNAARMRRLARSSPLMLAGAAVLTILVCCALFAPLIAPRDPNKLEVRRAFSPPSTQNLFGTDDFGRDIFSRVIFGARISLSISIIAITIAVVLGTLFGLLAGFFGGLLDTAIMRVMDIFFSFPPLLLAIAIAGVLGPGLVNAILAMVAIYVPTYARISRGPVLGELNREYIQAARLVGARDARIIFRHVLPNILTPIIIQATLSLGVAIIIESSLSYLGLGVQPPTAAWGVMLADGRAVLEKAPWMSVFPGLGIMLAVLAFNLLGDGLRDLLDPLSY